VDLSPLWPLGLGSPAGAAGPTGEQTPPSGPSAVGTTPYPSRPSLRLVRVIATERGADWTSTPTTGHEAPAGAGSETTIRRRPPVPSARHGGSRHDGRADAVACPAYGLGVRDHQTHVNEPVPLTKLTADQVVARLADLPARRSSPTRLTSGHGVRSSSPSLRKSQADENSAAGCSVSISDRSRGSWLYQTPGGRRLKAPAFIGARRAARRRARGLSPI